jgi:tRNA threonylcarbamoyladenosine biosynthesis protein TsaB
MPAVDGVLTSAGVTPAQLAGIAVASGPGGFSALRSGLGVVKGLAFAAGLPVIGVSTIEASAYPFRDVGLPVCGLIEAGRGAVAWARFQESNGWKRRTPDRVTSLESMLAARGRHTLFCGEGAGTHADAIREALGAKAHVVVETTPLTRLAGVAALGVARLQAGEAEPVATLRPRYLRSPSITPPKAPGVVPTRARS